MCDRATSECVDYFVANSRHIAKRIEQCYGRNSIVIHPPVAIGDAEASADRGSIM